MQELAEYWDEHASVERWNVSAPLKLREITHKSISDCIFFSCQSAGYTQPYVQKHVLAGFSEKVWV